MTTTNTIKGIETLDKFIADWREGSADWYREAAVSYFVRREELRAEIKAAATDSERLVIKRELRNMREFANKVVLDLNDSYFVTADGLTKYGEELLARILDREADRKREQFVSKVSKAVGEITDLSHLTIGAGGNIDGIAEGTEGRCHIRTIGAGGYNIQRFHYRVLVKSI